MAGRGFRDQGPNISLTRLVFIFHPGDEGYRPSPHTGPGQEIELARYGYEDTKVMDCVDSQEVPVLIMGLITDALDQETWCAFALRLPAPWPWSQCQAWRASAAPQSLFAKIEARDRYDTYFTMAN